MVFIDQLIRTDCNGNWINLLIKQSTSILIGYVCTLIDEIEKWVFYSFLTGKKKRDRGGIGKAYSC